MNLFALLPGDIAAEAKEIENFNKTGEMPDLNKVLLPVLISFRSSGFAAGKEVSTHFAKAQAMSKYGVKPYGFTLKLGCKQAENDDGKFFVPTIGQGRKCTPCELEKS